MRAAVFIIPPIVFYVTRRWCIGLQRADNDRLLHGYETGIIMRSPDGAYTERHLPISEQRAYTITARHRDEIYTPGVRDRRARRGRTAAPASSGPGPGSRAGCSPTTCRSRPSRSSRRPSHHAEHVHELEAGLDHPASGHEFDDHALRDADDVPLRSH